MRAHLADFNLMAAEGFLEGATEFFPEHKAALRYEAVTNSVETKTLAAKDFYEDGRDSLFSDVLAYGNLDDLRQFHAWLDALMASGKDYDMARIFTVNYEKFASANASKLDLTKQLFDQHFEYLLGLTGRIDASLLARIINDDLKTLLISSYCPILYIVFVDFLFQRGLPTLEAKRLLEGLASVVASVDEAGIYFLKLINSFVENDLLFEDSYQLFTELFFPDGLSAKSPESLKSIPLALVLDVLIKLSKLSDVNLEKISQAFSALKHLILTEAKVDEYFESLKLTSKEQALTISFDLLSRYDADSLSKSPESIRIYLKLVDGLFSLGADMPTICGFLVKAGLSSEQLSHVLTRVMSSAKGSDELKQAQVVALVYQFIRDPDLLADEKFKRNLKNLAHSLLNGKTLKELVFEHMLKNLSPEESDSLFRQVLAEHSALAAAKPSSLTLFFSESRSVFHATHLGAGVLKKINDSVQNTEQLKRVAEINKAYDSFTRPSTTSAAGATRRAGLFTPIIAAVPASASASTSDEDSDGAEPFGLSLITDAGL